MRTPNLDELLNRGPTRKGALVSLLWPKIRILLDRGHTIREIGDQLRLDGISVSYTSLCRQVANLRARDNGPAPESADRPPEKPVQPIRAVEPPARDPLAAVRRLTEERPPGFRYPGTLPERKLFGD